MNRWLVLCVLLLAAGCDEEPRVRPDNALPFVNLWVPSRTERVSYATTFRWAGWDPDGTVDHYEYAVDIPEEVTLDQINDPEDTEVAWVETTVGEMRFVFSTPEPDAAIEDGQAIVRAVDVGRHCLYVRAVDNEGASSLADFHCFTAENVHPRAIIETREPECVRLETIVPVGRTLMLRLRGEDPDGPEPDRPAYFEWRLVQLSPGESFQLPAIDVTSRVVSGQGATFPWNRRDADSTGLVLSLDLPREYLFAVRAVDENGGVEARFERGRNAVVLITGSSQGSPLLMVREDNLGSFTFPTEGEVVEYELPADFPVQFEFVASADQYGGVIQGFTWGLDVPDVEDDRWFRPWSLAAHTDLLLFDFPGAHTLTVKVRDCLGGVTIGTVILKVTGIPRDREVLYVDETRDGLAGDLDGQVIDMLRAAGYELGDISQVEVWEPGSEDPVEVKLADLARYRLVVWPNGPTLVSAASCRRVLQLYVLAGGGLWIYGQQMWASFRHLSSTGGCMADVRYYEALGMQFGNQDFPCRIMSICQPDIRNARIQPNVNGMLRGRPTAKANLEAFPVVEIDSTMFRQTGIPFVDAMFQPTFIGGLDTLYTLETPFARSSFQAKPAAFRYLDPDPASRQGPVAIFGFPFHGFLKAGSAEARTGVHGLARSMVAWFRGHQTAGASGP